MRRSLALAGLLAVAVAVATVLPGVGASASSGSALPSGFRAQSQAWVSPQRGWLMGAETCGSGTCTAVAGTVDGGTTWRLVGAIAAPITNEQATGVTEIRFADAMHGWAFDPALWATTDGGRTWTQESPNGRPTVALAGDGHGVYKVVSACPFDFKSIDRCKHDVTLWKTTAASGRWTMVALDLPKQIQALLAVHGRVAYVGVPMFDSPQQDVLDVTLDGQSWASRAVPCQPQQDEHLMGISAATETRMALLCQGNIGFGQAEKRVFRSADDAATMISAGQLPLLGVTGTQVAMAPNGVVIVTSSGQEDSVIYRNASHRTWNTVLDVPDGAVGWNDPLFTTNQVAWAVHGPSGCCGGFGPGQLGLSTDGGVTWNPI